MQTVNDLKELIENIQNLRLYTFSSNIRLKEEALKLFREAYLSKVKNFEKLKAIDKLDSLKAIANEIGKNIFA